jgi:antiviral helicase SKI2
MARSRTHVLPISSISLSPPPHVSESDRCTAEVPFRWVSGSSSSNDLQVIVQPDCDGIAVDHERSALTPFSSSTTSQSLMNQQRITASHGISRLLRYSAEAQSQYTVAGREAASGQSAAPPPSKASDADIVHQPLSAPAAITIPHGIGSALDGISSDPFVDLCDLTVSQPQFQYQLQRNESGAVIGFQHERTDVHELTPATSSSFMRKPAPQSQLVRGSVSNRAFRPGGLTTDDINEDEAPDSKSKRNIPQVSDKELLELLSSGDGSRLHSQAPGISSAFDADPSNQLRVDKLGEASSASLVADMKTMQQNTSDMLKPYMVDPALDLKDEFGDEYDIDAQATALAIAESKYADSKQQGPAILRISDLYDDLDMIISSSDDDDDDDDDDDKQQDLAGEMHKHKHTALHAHQHQHDHGHETVAGGSALQVHSQSLDDPKPEDNTLDAADDAIEDLLLDSSSMPIDEIRFGQKLNRVSKADARKKDWAVMKRTDVSDFYEQIPNMAIRFPFELDPFQKEAILHLERGESVFVAAHTSAGKTVVAEYAIAMAAKHLTRAVYTSPIKTLSNQKFREFRKTFGEDDVGVVTGDVSINPEASCLILTTEILRSMLYRGADLIRDIEWVIFDEVHYINDADRGVVWEEVIIMLPEHVNIILLSATVPNTREFAEWVGRTKQKRIFVISTDKRPVPLQHYLWCSNDMFLAVDKHKQLNLQGFKEARLSTIPEKERIAAAKHKNKPQPGSVAYTRKTYRKRGGNRNQWLSLIHFLDKRELLPVAVFAFSRRQCDESASALTSLDLTDSREKSEIHVFVEAALSRLSPADRSLPQILRIRELIKRGVGVHHAGMLPILKEVVEMVFSRGLVKVLFATETFAMGVNMPTKTVIFSHIRKHDGTNFRELHPGEYTQMSGRAGRRGLDSFGIVGIVCRDDDVPAESTIRNLVLGTPTRLVSQFRLTFNMILNLLRQEDMKVEDMIKRSFSEFATQKHAPEAKDQLVRGRARLASMPTIECKFGTPHLVEEYFSLSSQASTITATLMQAVMTQPKYTDKFLSTGRVLVVRKFSISKTVAVLLRVELPRQAKMAGVYLSDSRKRYVAMVLCPQGWSVPRRVAARLKASKNRRFKFDHANGSPYMIVELHAGDILSIGRDTMKLSPTSILVDERQHAISDAIEQLQKLHAGGLSNVETLHPRTDMKINDIDFVDDFSLQAKIVAAAEESPCHTCELRDQHYELMQKRSIVNQRVEQLRYQLSDANVELVGNFELMLKVLQQLKYVDGDRAVQLKGRVACEINTCDSLIVTELIFENVLNDLSAEEVVSLLSCLIFQQKKTADPVLSDRLSDAHKKLHNIALGIGRLQRDCNIDIVPEDFARENVVFGMMQVAYEWARGTAFSAICQLTEIPEGSIVRCITRLDETCRDVRNAARVIGDPNLYQKMELASDIIKRDIVFAASLYTV